ncbi:unnamed protein product [Cladocopium goreaui]|uniref:J domain-containing protein n=1 Tax=Cladocopium goreaui TaxID=2562237 RepID=A0A9P1CBB7_9DINO|nr:unnamed protein product [Cladocopium goreaui]
MDNFRLHPFCVSAYYPGEAQEVIEARKTSFVPGKKSAPGSRREDCFFFETIRIPFNPRQQLLHVDIFEVQVPLQMEFEDEWVGRATLQLADPRVEEPAEYELTRGPFEYGGTVTVSVKFPDPEVEAHPLPDVRDFPKPVSPREYVNSKTMGTDAGGIDMSPCDIPRKGSGSSSNSTGQGKSPQPVWVPEIKGPGGSGFGLDPKIDNIWKFNTGPAKGGTMSPLPSFPPQWFTAKLPPGTPAPRQLPPSAFQPPPVPPGLMAQIPVLATVPPAVAAMVVEALRAPPLTTATMPAPPASVLLAGPLPYLPSIAPPYCGGAPNLSGFVAPTVFHAPARGRNMCCVAH